MLLPSVRIEPMIGHSSRSERSRLLRWYQSQSRSPHHSIAEIKT
jgi:hypothetical protein